MLVLVPAFMMVSRIRFRSFGALTLRSKHTSLVLLQFAILIAAIAVEPQIVLFAMAYSYLISGPIGLGLGYLHPRSERLSSGETETANLPTSQAG